MCQASDDDRLLMPRIDEKGSPFPHRALEIIIDHDGIGGPSTYKACGALTSASHPILLSQTLVDMIFFKKKINVQELEQSLWQNASDQKYYQHSLPYQEYCQLTFNANDWDVYKPTNDFTLFIPHAYTQAIGAHGLSSTALDLAHGLRLSTLHKYTFEDLRKSLSTQDDLDQYNFCHIFVENKEYKKPAVTTQCPQWVFYMYGHGWAETDIVGMPISQFKKEIMPFFAQAITTKLLAYSSCYANGLNTEIIYGDNNACASQYPFPIIAESMYDRVVNHLPCIAITKDKKQKPVIRYAANSRTFFRDAMRDTPVTLINFFPTGSHYTNILMPIFIRYPNKRAFVPLLHSLFIGAEDAKKTEPLDLKKALEENKTESPHYVFLTTPTISTPIIVNTDKFALASMIPGPVTHLFSHVISTIPLPTFRKKFYGSDLIPEAPIKKNFFIRQLEADNNIFFDVCVTPFGPLFGKTGKDASIINLIPYEKLNPIEEKTRQIRRILKLGEYQKICAKIYTGIIPPQISSSHVIISKLPTPIDQNLLSSRTTSSPPSSPRVLSMPMTSSAPSILPQNQTALSLPLPNTPYHPAIENNNNSYSSLLIAGASIVAGTAVYQYFKKSTKNKKKKSKKYLHQALK